jgi:aldehyde dehydrogenase (NAD+)
MADDAVLTGEGRMLIDGELVEASGGATYGNINPATEEEIGRVADASPEDMERAITAARRAFDETDWAEDKDFRKRCLRQLAEGLAKERETLRPQIVGEVGAPISLTYAIQQDSCIDDMEWDIECIDRIEWEYDLPVHEFFGQRSARRVLREPVGVVGAITPWNFPFMLNLSKIVPALAAGNTVILKPAPDTPWSATHIGKVAQEYTDLPPGVFNVVTGGDAASVGEVLTGDERVDMISFTGSTVTGKRIMARGSETLKRVFLELGGKSANILLDDADFSSLAMGSMICMHGGQGCAITTRYLLPRSRYDEGVELLKTSFENWSYGDPNDPANLQGPLINARQRERVLGFIEKGKEEGAKCLVGGGPATQFEKGYYVQPTLFVDVDPDSTIAQQEIFGPVLVVIPYEDDDDAVRIANNSRYGLSGAVSSKDFDRAYAIAKRMRTGTVAVNGGQWFGPDSPFGGYKESGIGREHGVDGFLEYLNTKTLGLPA